MRISSWVSGLTGLLGIKRPKAGCSFRHPVVLSLRCGAVAGFGEVNSEFGQALREARDGEGGLMRFERYLTPAQRAMLVERYVSGWTSDEDRIAAIFRQMVMM